MSRRKSPVAGKAWQQLSLAERFSASYKADKKTGCWNWLKPGSQRYGGIDVDGKTIAAHRASWLLHCGAIPEGLCILHKCDNRLCVNPKHLYVGDKKQNRKDFMERHPRAKQIVANAIRAGTAAVKKFWASMDEKKRKAFCKRRSKVQAEKRRLKLEKSK